MAELNRVRRWAEALIALHLNDAHRENQWKFGFDAAKTRAGLCNYTERRITVSRYLAARYDDDEIHQVLLHEVAHAIAGSGAGHGPRWKAVAKNLGYEGKRLHDGAIANELAPWVGSCSGGHIHYRYRKPTRALACGRCAKRFDPAHLIVWQQRRVPAASSQGTATPRL